MYSFEKEQQTRLSNIVVCNNKFIIKEQTERTDKFTRFYKYDTGLCQMLKKSPVRHASA